ncbi:MAG: ABC transporter ATP-binding protein [Pseudomonadota bacterium]|nr:ABC transporter ATP-binding protein [Pseudomonadota bacterium]MEE3294466.1 ABC transporter ATP-binding protein [Pseudomonadota bacterium]
MLKFTNVFKNYDKSVLADISIEVEEGEFISILGPSGSGKSTILRLASKLISPSRGEITYKNNKPPSIGFVFQDATLMPWRNVLDNIILPLELNGVRRSISTKKAAEWIKKVGLEGKENSFPGELSGGQKMRVSLARSMVTDCNLLLLDEPFAALDEITRRKLEEDLLKIWMREKFTILLVTHSVSEAVYLSERVIVLSGGPGKIISDKKIFKENFDQDFRNSQQLLDLNKTVYNLLAREENP